MYLHCFLVCKMPSLASAQKLTYEINEQNLFFSSTSLGSRTSYLRDTHARRVLGQHRPCNTWVSTVLRRYVTSPTLPISTTILDFPHFREKESASPDTRHYKTLVPFLPFVWYHFTSRVDIIGLGPTTWGAGAIYLNVVVMKIRLSNNV